MRDSPTIDIIRGLQQRGAHIRAFDPAAMDNARQIFENVDYRADAYAVAEEADVVVVATEWNQFRHLDLERVKDAMRTPMVLDMRNIYDPQRMRGLGFTYDCVGRPQRGRLA
jgi:UDPglucose 6-dehydrogenase